MNAVTRKHRLVALATALIGAPLAATEDRPNIVWLTTEDHGPHMGSYGDAYATTPRMDALASQGLRYSFAWSNAPVCAPARSVIISGLHAPATGSEHMRSMVPYPAGKRMFPWYLREGGYYCTNNSKEDYNLPKTGRVWDESSERAHWRNRPDGRPFFAVFNAFASHESNIRRRPHELQHDPALVRVPAYHPDTPETRRDWAQYYDGVTAADAASGERLDELEQAGLIDDTIVIFFADHGSGMPRSKRWPYNSGLQVPLIVYIPEKFAHLRPPNYEAGGTSDRLVSFVDLAPTVLSLAGIEPPGWMHGRAFLGSHQVDGPDFVHGYRGRMDERDDLVRSVSDGRFVYIRNFKPHLIYGQRIDYMFQTPTTRIWWEMHQAGRLNEVQDQFWNSKPPEELYDLRSDPDEVGNLAYSPDHAAIRQRLSAALREQAAGIRDVGLLPEGELFTRFSGSPMDQSGEDERYPFERVFSMAWEASLLEPGAVPRLVAGIDDDDSAVRWWAASGLLMRGDSAVSDAAGPLRAALEDTSPFVQIAAAEALWVYGEPADRRRAEEILRRRLDPDLNGALVTLAALQAVDAIGIGRLPAIADEMSSHKWSPAVPHTRYTEYVPQLAEGMLGGAHE